MKIFSIEEATPLKGVTILEYVCEDCETDVRIKKNKMGDRTRLLCRNCKTRETKLKKYGDPTWCNEEKIRKTKLERHGDPNYNGRDKAKKTCLERYGNETYLCSDEAKEKTKTTVLERYGVDHVWKDQKCREKCKQTSYARYGKSLHDEDKRKTTCLEKYGVDHPMKSEEVMDRTKKTDLGRYGVEYHVVAPEVREKVKVTFRAKYGVGSPFESPEVRAIASATIARHASEDPEYYKKRAAKASKTRSSLGEVDGVYVDSSWEASFVRTHPGCKRGPSFEYDWNGKRHVWLVDFEWENEYYEVKSPWSLAAWDSCGDRSLSKLDASKRLGVKWYFWEPGSWSSYDPDERFEVEEKVAASLTSREAFREFVKLGRDEYFRKNVKRSFS